MLCSHYNMLSMLQLCLTLLAVCCFLSAEDLVPQDTFLLCICAAFVSCVVHLTGVLKHTCVVARLCYLLLAGRCSQRACHLACLGWQSSYLPCHAISWCCHKLCTLVAGRWCWCVALSSTDWSACSVSNMICCGYLGVGASLGTGCGRVAFPERMHGHGPLLLLFILLAGGL
ncbi:hypothetical protein COO60DRAFT_765002 [Scenedesmus sp. NREL 46B-D3]|nr:hypothetical protein COO60DRAFT_765002 [Scenedesmus sp. NREL 46B-D3]